MATILDRKYTEKDEPKDILSAILVLANERNWTPTEALLPPEGVTVDGMVGNGKVFLYRRSGRLWFVGPKFDTYVYYEPSYWRLSHER